MNIQEIYLNATMSDFSAILVVLIQIGSIKSGTASSVSSLEAGLPKAAAMHGRCAGKSICSDSIVAQTFTRGRSGISRLDYSGLAVCV